jgi:hypothetical protein
MDCACVSITLCRMREEAVVVDSVYGEMGQRLIPPHDHRTPRTTGRCTVPCHRSGMHRTEVASAWLGWSTWSRVSSTATIEHWYQSDTVSMSQHVSCITSGGTRLQLLAAAAPAALFAVTSTVRKVYVKHPCDWSVQVRGVVRIHYTGLACRRATEPTEVEGSGASLWKYSEVLNCQC